MLDVRTDFERTLREMDAFRRQMDALFDTLDTGWSRGPGWSANATAFPAASLYDQGSELVLSADVPGVAPDAIDLQVTARGLTVSGERKVEAPQGYKVHRQERTSYRFSRSFQLPVKVDADRVTAEVRNGVLTVRLPKAAEVQPRRITING